MNAAIRILMEHETMNDIEIQSIANNMSSRESRYGALAGNLMAGRATLLRIENEQIQEAIKHLMPVTKGIRKGEMHVIAGGVGVGRSLTSDGQGIAVYIRENYREDMMYIVPPYDSEVQAQMWRYRDTCGEMIEVDGVYYRIILTDGVLRIMFECKRGHSISTLTQ